ncbi:pseudouridine synthase [Alkalisalibacterium limincola]|uniref:Pseudouridine synthase n=1 Tax=Alkalisalibacterium limincola TaxID=2699169 RepID=A0A5C8KXN9_9GAMM|nr:pseudouridine synthase [Alkalisalibacterium limincola]TXK64353.1 pseudouridine synthase [Alkalisalibacterium limincola]
MRRRPPVVDGLAASRLQLPPGPWPSVLDALCARFPGVSREQWRDRMARGRVLGPEGVAVRADTPYRVGLEISYYREVPDEPRLALEEGIVHLDAHVLVADKPHGLPVTPAGTAVRETLLARLVRRVGNEALIPLHRIDRDTAGLVMFSTNPETRAAYQALFREQRIQKYYQALAPPLPGLQWPRVHRSRLARGEPFFRMHEVPGEPNSETRMDVLERGGQAWRYQLEPVSGRKHQLRVHMASLGAPILGDRLYPQLQPGHHQPAATALQLLAAGLAFIDPLDATMRRFDSGLTLPAPARD